MVSWGSRKGAFMAVKIMTLVAHFFTRDFAVFSARPRRCCHAPHLACFRRAPGHDTINNIQLKLGALGTEIRLVISVEKWLLGTPCDDTENDARRPR